VQVNVSSGSGSDTSGNLDTNIPYQVGLDGGGVENCWYDEDFGEIILSSAEFNPSTAEYSFNNYGRPIDKLIRKIGNIDDVLDETTGDTASTSKINGVNASISGGEIQCGTATCTADDTLFYNESGTSNDNVWFIQPTFAVSGTDGQVEDYSICFDFDDSNGPEGNEITQLTASEVDELGAAFNAVGTNNWKDIWSKEQCVIVGTLFSGFRDEVRFTVTYDESLLDANDIWTMRVDDLGGWQQKDDLLNKGAAFDTITFDSYDE